MALAEARERLSRYRIGVVGQRAIDFLPMRRLANIEIYVVCEGGEDATHSVANSQLISPEQSELVRRQWTNQSIGALTKLAQSAVDHRATIVDPIYLLLYASSSQWEDFATLRGDAVRIVGIPSSLKDTLDDKVYVRQRLAEAGLPVPIGSVISTHGADFSGLSHELGLPLILQRRTGSAGIGTYLIRCESEFRNVVEKDIQKEWLASAFAGLTTFNAHGFVDGEQVTSSIPSVQLTGVPGLSSNPAVYCGNDFTAINDVAISTVERCIFLTKAVGQWLSSQGYRGLFGIDLAGEDSDVRILEINPRLQGSTWLLGEIEYEARRVPSTVNHFLSLLGHKASVEQEPISKPIGAHAIVHCDTDTAVQLAVSPKAGVYVLGPGDDLTRVRSGDGLVSLSEQEILLFGLPPRRAFIDPGAVMARFATRQRLSSSGGRALSGFGQRILRGILKKFEFSPGSDGSYIKRPLGRDGTE